MSEEYYTVIELSEEVGITIPMVRKMIHKGDYTKTTKHMPYNKDIMCIPACEVPKLLDSFTRGFPLCSRDDCKYNKWDRCMILSELTATLKKPCSFWKEKAV